jgi:hypothetical protein
LGGLPHVEIAKPILKSLKKRLNWIQKENINKLVKILTPLLEMFEQGKQNGKRRRFKDVLCAMRYNIHQDRSMP